MRPFLFGNSIFRQARCLELGLEYKDIGLLEYFYQLTLSTNLTYIRKKEIIYDDGLERDVFYFYITYKKIKEDMPILKWGERSLRESITKLENVGLVKRFKFENRVFNSKGHIIMPGARMLYLAVNVQPLLESTTEHVVGRDTSLKAFIVNRDINQSYEPQISFKDNEFTYFNPGMNLNKLNVLEDFFNQFEQILLKYLKMLLTNKSLSYFNDLTVRLKNNNAVVIKFWKEETVKSIVSQNCFKLEQAIVDTYKQLCNKITYLENKN